MLRVIRWLSSSVRQFKQGCAEDKDEGCKVKDEVDALTAFTSSFRLHPCSYDAPVPFIIASRLALNSVPGFHSGYLSPCATVWPTMKRSCASSTAPDKSQSGLTSSEGLW